MPHSVTVPSFAAQRRMHEIIRCLEEGKYVRYHLARQGYRGGAPPDTLGRHLSLSSKQRKGDEEEGQ